MEASPKPLGVIAGAGKLPVLLAREARTERPLVIVSVAQEPESELRQAAAVFHTVPVGKIASILRAFHDAGVSELAILGSVRKEVLLHPTRLDWLALKILASAKTHGDQAIFQAIAREFTRRGFTIADQREYLKALVPEPGVLTRRKPRPRQEREARHALELARQVAALDIGQTVVVQGAIPLAVEAMEGTDAAIRRGGKLGREGVIVAKAARPGHDFRFDVPTIGLETLNALCEVRASLLVVEAGRTFLLDRERLLQNADAAKIVVIAL